MDNHQRIDGIYNKKKANFLTSPTRDSILTNSPLNQETIDCTLKKCSPQFQSWRLIEPLYVEEPKFVQINSGEFDTKLGEYEPFFVTRGKRSMKLKILTPKNNNDFTIENKLKSQKRDTIQENNNQIIDEKSEKKKNIKIIQKRSENNDNDNDNEKLLTNLEKSLNIKGGTGKSFSYLHPRNKHSDILEILDDPFFISRGKKDNNNNNYYYYHHPINDYSIKDYLWDQYLNQHLDKFLSDFKTEDKILPEIDLTAKQQILEKTFNNDIRKKRINNENRKLYESNTKRNILDEIKLDLDPFYIARG